MKRSGFIGASDIKAINFYAGRVALPCLLFKAIADLQFAAVQWSILFALLSAKVVCWRSCAISHRAAIGIAAVYTFFAEGKSSEKVGLIGVFSQIVGSSADLSIGLPIIMALLPEFAIYQFLIVLPQFTVFDAFSCLLCELGVTSAQRQQQVLSAILAGSYFLLSDRELWS